MAHEIERVLRGMRRRGHADFSDYLELRRLRDDDHRADTLDSWLERLERELSITFASAIPHMTRLDDAPDAPPRGLDREHVRVVFAMREEVARLGETRRHMMGIDLPERPGLLDWLDFVETDRKHALASRKALRELDGKIWAVFTGERRLPACSLPDDGGPSRMLHQ